MAGKSTIPPLPESTKGLREELKCRKCGSRRLDKDGDCLSCGESREGYDDHDLVCEICEGRGFLFPHGEDTGYVCVEKCDQCASQDTYDDDVAAKLCTQLQKIDPRYAVAGVILPGMKWEECGAHHFVVLKYEDADPERAIPGAWVPIDFEEGEALAYKLGIYHAEPDVRCCPRCGGTSLDVQLSAVFRWDGAANALGPENLASCEFPVEDNAMVVCNGRGGEPCDYTCKVKDLKPKK